MQYVLNDSSSHDQAGIVEAFPSLQTLLLRIDPVDVRRHDYHAFDEEGYLLDIRIDHDTGRVFCQGRSGMRDLAALDHMLKEQVESLRLTHPGCVDRPQDVVAALSGKDLTAYVLQVYENIEMKWKDNRLLSRVMKRIAAGWNR